MATYGNRTKNKNKFEELCNVNREMVETTKTDRK